MLELGLTFDFGQMVIDDEIAAMNHRVLQGISWDAESLAVDLIKKVGSDGHFMREQHTRRLIPIEQSQVEVIDRRMRGQWEKRGGQEIHERALQRARDILAHHEVVPLPAEAEGVIAEVKRRVAGEIAAKG